MHGRRRRTSPIKFLGGILQTEKDKEFLEEGNENIRQHLKGIRTGDAANIPSEETLQDDSNTIEEEVDTTGANQNPDYPIADKKLDRHHQATIDFWKNWNQNLHGSDATGASNNDFTSKFNAFIDDV